MGISSWLQGICRFAAIQWQEGDVATYVSGLKTSDQIRPGFVSIHDPAVYARNRVFTSPDGKQGFALIDHGDGRVEISGVYNNDPKNRGAGREAVQQGYKLGGNYLEAFERDPAKNQGFSLPEYYHKTIGARPVRYEPFDQQYAHPQWDYESHGRPGIVGLSIPQGSRSDADWAGRQHDPLDYAKALEEAKMRRQKTASKNVVRLGYSSADPIEAYEEWECKTNARHAKKVAAQARIKLVK